MTIDETTFSTKFPELVTDSSVLVNFDNKVPGWLLEIGSLASDICVPKEFLDSIAPATIQDIYEEIQFLWIAHTLVISHPVLSAQFLDDNLKKVESLDNKMEWTDLKVSSKYDFNLTSYGRRYLNMLDKYSCLRQAEVARESLHEMSGFGLEANSSCEDDWGLGYLQNDAGFTGGLEIGW